MFFLSENIPHLEVFSPVRRSSAAFLHLLGNSLPFILSLQLDIFYTSVFPSDFSILAPSTKFKSIAHWIYFTTFSQDVLSFAKMCVEVEFGFSNDLCSGPDFCTMLPWLQPWGWSKVTATVHWFLPSMCSILMQKPLLEVLKLLWLPFRNPCGLFNFPSISNT